MDTARPPKCRLAAQNSARYGRSNRRECDIGHLCKAVAVKLGRQDDVTNFNTLRGLSFNLKFLPVVDLQIHGSLDLGATLIGSQASSILDFTSVTQRHQRPGESRGRRGAANSEPKYKAI
jgi:hypothetical protein